MPLKHALITALMLMLAWANPGLSKPSARLAVSPDRYEVEFDANGGPTESLVVKNLANVPLTIQVSLSNWELDENNIVREIPPQEDSLDQWMVINPLVATIPPDSPQTFRWAILPRQQPEPREYRAIIFVEEVLGEQEAPEGASVRMKLRYGIPVYAQFGDVKHKATIKRADKNTQTSTVVLDLANRGNRHARLRGHYGVWSEAQFPGKKEALKILAGDKDDEHASIAKIHDVVVLPDNERTTAIEPRIQAPGNYILQFDASFADMPFTDTINLRRQD